MAKQGRTTHPTLEGPTDDRLPVEHLANIHQVLHGEQRLRTQVVLTRLAELNPTAYEGWGFSDLKAALAEEGVEIGKSHGHSVVRADDITQALTRNDNRESDDDGGN